MSILIILLFSISPEFSLVCGASFAWLNQPAWPGLSQRTSLLCFPKETLKRWLELIVSPSPIYISFQFSLVRKLTQPVQLPCCISNAGIVAGYRIRTGDIMEPIQELFLLKTLQPKLHLKQFHFKAYCVLCQYCFFSNSDHLMILIYCYC